MNKKIKIFLILIVIILGSLILIRNSNLKNSKDNKERIEELAGLPYLDYVTNEKDQEKKGVTINKENQTSKGLNIFTSRSNKEIVFLDMDGNIINTIKFPEKFKDLNFYFSTLSKKGPLLIDQETGTLAQIDWNSNILWYKKDAFNHEIYIDKDSNNIYTINSKKREIVYKNKTIPIKDDYITILSSEGKIIKEISMYNLFKEDIPDIKLNNINKAVNNGKKIDVKGHNLPFDIFHANTINKINRNIGIAKEGDLFVCFRNINLIAIIDPKLEKVIWKWKGEGILDYPHYPNLLNEESNIILLDNGYHKKYSRIIKLNPINNNILWEYTAEPKENFHSFQGGWAPVLPNDNILITSEYEGKVFEITKEGEKVWEFWNFNFNRKNTREAIYRFQRLSKEELENIEFDEKFKTKLKKLDYI